MPKYKFKARNEKGEVIESLLEAASEEDLRQKIDDLRYFLVEFSEQKISLQHSSGKKIQLKDLSVFSWQLFTMLNSGMTLLDSLRSVANQSKNLNLRKSIDNVAGKVENGVSFTEALSGEGGVFPPLLIHMVDAGEKAGILEKIMERLSHFLESQSKARSQIQAAMTYPSILLFVSAAVTLFLICVILPRFGAMFEGMETPPPFITVALLAIGTVLKKYFLFIAVGVAAAVFGIKRYLKTAGGIALKDKVSLTAPILGPLTNMAVISGFTKTFSALLAADMPVVDALGITANTISNGLIQSAIREACEDISQGEKVADSLDKSKLFSSMVINMVGLGERTGKLSETMSKVSEFYDRELEEAIENFTKMIEPVFLVGMAVLVGVICLAIFLPLTSVMQGV